MQAVLQWRRAVLVYVRVSGHAAAGQVELCIAASCLLRSCASAIQELRLPAACWQLSLPQEGEFVWRLIDWPAECLGVVQGISSVLATGLRRLAADFPALELRELAAN